MKLVTKKCKRSADLLSINKCSFSVKKVLHLKCTYGRSGFSLVVTLKHGMQLTVAKEDLACSLFLIDCILWTRQGPGMIFWNLGINGTWVQFMMLLVHMTYDKA